VGRWDGWGDKLYRFLVGMPDGKRLLGKSKCRWHEMIDKYVQGLVRIMKERGYLEGLSVDGTNWYISR
jgi:hypothetical protein